MDSVCPPPIHILKPNPQCDGIWRQGLWEARRFRWGHESGVLMMGLVPWGTPLQYSCLENPMDGGAWWAAVHGVARSRTWLSDFTFTFHFHALEKEMATHSSVPCCLENPRGGEVWWAAIYGVAQSWTRLKRLSSSKKKTREPALFLPYVYTARGWLSLCPQIVLGWGHSCLVGASLCHLARCPK